MTVPLNKLFPVLVLLAAPVLAENLIVRSGGQLICRTNLTVSSGKITLEDGASMVIDAAAVNCRDFQLDSTASLAATGTLGVSGFWINDSGFVKSTALEMPKAVSSLSQTNQAIGFGDTDNDGISDRGEGSFDANANGVADFIDPAQAAPTAHIPVDWLVQMGLPTDHSQDHADADSDGTSNWSEYHAMTEPFDPDSVLAITEFAWNSPSTGAVAVTWSSVDGRCYELQYGTNLTAAGFSTAASGLVGEDGTTTVSLPEASDRQGFYRIRVLP
ncbi:hypothetical protein [Pontiella sp.]|uniref:hypothetical protein n=1 Tax=Pontiella sp. TaxID=2837462 RepID=UPI0035666B7E